MQSIREIENVLETYSLEDILELNDCASADALYFLLQENFITELPTPQLIDLDD